MSKARVPKPLGILGDLVNGLVSSVHSQVFLNGKHKPNRQRTQHKYEKNYYVVHHHWNAPKPKKK